jgi:hypothetical protein
MNKIEEAKYRLQTMKEFLREGYVDIKAARGCIDRAIALLEKASEKDAPSPASTFTARLMLRIADVYGQEEAFGGFTHLTVLAGVTDSAWSSLARVQSALKNKEPVWLPEVIGAEWLLTSEVEK